MGLLGKFFKKEEKIKGWCCSFNLEDEIAKVNVKEEILNFKTSYLGSFLYSNFNIYKPTTKKDDVKLKGIL